MRIKQKGRWYKQQNRLEHILDLWYCKDFISTYDKTFTEKQIARKVLKMSRKNRVSKDAHRDIRLALLSKGFIGILDAFPVLLRDGSEPSGFMEVWSKDTILRTDNKDSSIIKGDRSRVEKIFKCYT